MKRWMKVLLLTLLAGMVIAGLGSVLPARAADGEVILYRVNAGGNQVNATDGGPNWARDSASNPHQYNTSNRTTTGNIERSLGGQLQGAAPDAVYRSYRTWQQTSSELSYSFPVTPGRTYRINLYFADPRYSSGSDGSDRVFDVSVDGNVPSAFDDITLVRRTGTSPPNYRYHIPVMKTAEVTATDSSLDLVWSRVGQRGSPYPLVSGIEIIELVPDSTPPEVEITNPVDGDIVSGVIRIEADADDNMAVKQVEFFVDGTFIGADENGANGWSVDWDTSEGLDGEHTLKAVATDTAGNSAEHSITVTVDNNAAPTVSITRPADGSTVNKPVTIVANATDDAGVSSVAFYYVDGGTDVLIGNGTASEGVWTYSGWNPADGQYTLKAVATDNAGNSTTSASVTITVVTPDTTAPTVSITSPAAGSTVADVTTITASATDDGTVTRVEFFVDDTFIGADENDADGWSVDWDTTGDVDGWHVLTAKATDDSNNTGESDGVEVLVDNIPTVLEIVRPTSGAPVSGQVEIALSGSPDLMRVVVYLDDEYLDEATLVDGVWTLLWDTTAFEDGVYTLTAYGMTEQGIKSQAMQVTVQNTETPPGDEPTPTVPDVLPAMLCDLDDGSLNAHHCGRPVAIFRSGDELHLYGIDINTGNGSLALLVTAADIESAGVPEDVPVLIAVGENPYTHRPIALYRLPGGEFQLNTAYWDGKEYIVKWQPGAAHVEVIYW